MFGQAKPVSADYSKPFPTSIQRFYQVDPVIYPDGRFVASNIQPGKGSKKAADGVSCRHHVLQICFTSVGIHLLWQDLGFLRGPEFVDEIDPCSLSPRGC